MADRHGAAHDPALVQPTLSGHIRRLRNRGAARATLLGVAVAILALVALSPGSLLAHLRLARAEPAPESVVDASPTAIRLWFTEAPQRSPVSLALITPRGDTLPVDSVFYDRRAGNALVGVLRSALAPGRYIVRWRVVSADGHPTRGQFGFTVAQPQPAAAPLAADSGRPRSEQAEPRGEVEEPDGFGVNSPLYVAVRALNYVALLALLGAIVFRLAVLGLLARRSAPLDVELQGTLSAAARRVALGAASLLLVTTASRLLAQSYAVQGSADALRPAALGALVADSLWGRSWVATAVTALICTLVLFRARAADARPWRVAATGALVLAVSSALSGHAASSDPVPFVVAVHALHLVCAAAWLGSLLVLVAAGIPTVMKAPSADRAMLATELVKAFSIVALSAGAGLLLTGAVSSWLHVGALGALWGSGYGRVLLAKLGALAVVAALGAYNWRVATPAARDVTTVSRLRRSGARELVAAILVIVLTSLLVATPPPADDLDATPPLAAPRPPRAAPG